MKTQELRDLDIKALEAKVNELEEQHFNFRFQAELGQLENPMKLRDVRRDIARVKTILNEKRDA